MVIAKAAVTTRHRQAPNSILAPGVVFYFYFFFKKFIYLFLAVSGLCCCAWTFSSCGEQGLLFVAVRGLLVAVASLVEEHGL